jgi:WD40 repeat protein
LAFLLFWCWAPFFVEAAQTAETGPTNVQGQKNQDPSPWPKVVAPPRTIQNFGSVTAIGFSPDSATLTSFHLKKPQTLILNEVATGKEIRRIPYDATHVHVIAYAPDGRSFATGDTTFTVHLWDLKSGTQTKTLGDTSVSVAFAQFSPQGGTLAAVGSGLQVFDLSTGNVTLNAGGYHDYVDKDGQQTFGPTEWYSSLALSPDGRWVATAHSGSLEKDDWDETWTIKVWSLPKGEEAFSLKGHTGEVTAAAFSPDGRRLATTGNDRTFRIWDLAGRREIYHHTIEDQGAPKRLSYFPDGKRLAVGMASRYDRQRKIHEDGDSSIRIYDADTGAGLGRLPSHEGGVVAMGFSPDGTWLASVGMRGPIYLWKVESLSGTQPGVPDAASPKAPGGASPALTAPVAEDFTISPERLDALMQEAGPRLEKAMGHLFKAPPKLLVSTPEAVRDILAAEIEPTLRIRTPDLNAEKRKEAALQMADLMSHIYFGKYEPGTNRVHLVPENFSALAKELKRPLILTPDFLRLVVIHELVHAMDNQELKVWSRIDSLNTVEELSVLNALIEGHAQQVTHEILAAGGQEKVFAAYEEILQSDPPSSSAGEKFVAQVFATQFRAPYIEGRKFLDGLAASGKKNYVEDVFSKAPASMDVILHPERYYDPAKRREMRDLGELFDDLAKRQPGWASTKVRVGELEVRTSFGDFVDAREVKEVSTHLIGGQAVVVQTESGSQMAVFLILEADSPVTASKLGDLFGKLTRAKEERLKEGTIRILKAARAPLATKAKVANELTRMTIQAGPQTVETSDAIAIQGEWVVEVLHSNMQSSDEEIASTLDRIFEFLKTGKK